MKIIYNNATKKMKAENIGLGFKKISNFHSRKTKKSTKGFLQKTNSDLSWVRYFLVMFVKFILIFNLM